MTSVYSLIRNGQEIVNSRFKDCGILNHVYRHGINKHSDIFRYFVIITQLDLNNGKFFQCDYKDLPWYNVIENT